MEIKFNSDAKSIVDTLFDAKLFKETITRDQMNGVEDLIKYMMESRVSSHLKAMELYEQVRSKEVQNVQ